MNIKNDTSEPTVSRGHLIVIEGLDRSGKTTQCQALCEDIRGLDKKVKYIKFPGMFYLTDAQVDN